MINNDTKQSEIKILTKKDQSEPPRKPYLAPKLEEIGDLRSLTLGGTPGTGDTGATFGVRKIPGM
jgi:hypothetical protein